MRQGRWVGGAVERWLALAGDLAGEGACGSALSVLTRGCGFGGALGPRASGWVCGFGVVVAGAVGAGAAAIALVAVFTQVEETLDVGDEPAAAAGAD